MSRLMTKQTKWHVRPAKTQIYLGIKPVRLESLLSARRKLGSLATHWAHSEDSDQTGWMPRLIWVSAGRTVILLVLSWDGSYTRAIFDIKTCAYYGDWIMAIAAANVCYKVYQFLLYSLLNRWLVKWILLWYSTIISSDMSAFSTNFAYCVI